MIFGLHPGRSGVKAVVCVEAGADSDERAGRRHVPRAGRGAMEMEILQRNAPATIYGSNHACL